MSAKEMFEELEYKQARNDNDYITYERVANSGHTNIMFVLKSKEIKATYGFCSRGEYYHKITLDEFRAIVQQTKELGWFEEEKQKTKEENNFAHYRDEILNLFIDDLAMYGKELCKCDEVDCSVCSFNNGRGSCRTKRNKWLNQPYEKPTYQLTKFEFDLLRINYMSHKKRLYDFSTYKNLKEIGYFKDIDFNLTIDEILADCEVVKDEKC